MVLEACPGCGGLLKPREGPTHRYMRSSAACWEAFGRVLAAEYSDRSLLPTHRLSVDTYAVQHPGDGSRAAVQSVGLHLARLLTQLENPRSPAETNEVMLGLGARKASLPALRSPPVFTMTVADVAPYAGTAAHADKVRAWADAAWRDWSGQHDVIRSWLAGRRASGPGR